MIGWVSLLVRSQFFTSRGSPTICRAQAGWLGTVLVGAPRCFRQGVTHHLQGTCWLSGHRFGGRPPFAALKARDLLQCTRGEETEGHPERLRVIRGSHLGGKRMNLHCWLLQAF